MDAQDLRKLLEKAEDKFNIFVNKKILGSYKFDEFEFFDLIKDFLTDEEIIRLYEYPQFKGFEYELINVISNQKLKIQMIIKFEDRLENYQVVNLFKQLDDEGKKEILYNKEFIEKRQFEDCRMEDMISSLSNHTRENLLADKNLMKGILQFTDKQIVDLTKDLSSEESKNKIMELYQFSDFYNTDILVTFSYESKLQILLNKKKSKTYDKIRILSTFNVKELIKIINENKNIFTENNIKPYEIIQSLDIEAQKFFVTKLENINLTLNEKRKVLAYLGEETKKKIDITNFKEEYKTAISIEKDRLGNYIIVDFNRNLEDYRGFDENIKIYPYKLNEVQKTKLLQLCEICPNLEIIYVFRKGAEFISTGKEYKEAEEWIATLLNSLKPKYTEAQKLAIIDNAIGKKISYSPDFETEISNSEDCRNIWKIISSGYGVCNGIARVEQYILSKIGIESEVISGKNHAFLKIKNIELPLANGEIVKGNTIVDPTWNLANHRFGAAPDNFCKSYQEIRKNDINKKGDDSFSHKNDEELQDATLNLDDNSLTQLFKSVGLTHENGKFPITDICMKSQLLDILYENQPYQNIEKHLNLLSKVCPEFAICQNSSMRILSDILLNKKYIKFKKCVAKRVYDRKDKQKRPVLYVYIDLGEKGKKFYYADKEEAQFKELPQEEFVKKFECYKKDLEKEKGIRPWKIEEQEKENIDLTTSSSTIVAQEGEEK